MPSNIKQQHLLPCLPLPGSLALRRSVSMGSNLDHVDKDVPWAQKESIKHRTLEQTKQKHADKYNYTHRANVEPSANLHFWDCFSNKKPLLFRGIKIIPGMDFTHIHLCELNLAVFHPSSAFDVQPHALAGQPCNVITGLYMCKVCTEAVHSVAF